MPLELYFAFVMASVALVLMPGPNVAVIVTNAVTYGPRYGLLAVAGTSSALVPQLTVVTLGLSASSRSSHPLILSSPSSSTLAGRCSPAVRAGFSCASAAGRTASPAAS